MGAHPERAMPQTRKTALVANLAFFKSALNVSNLQDIKVMKAK